MGNLPVKLQDLKGQVSDVTWRLASFWEFSMTGVELTDLMLFYANMDTVG